MIRAIHSRAPTRCITRLLGTSNRKYQMKNIPAPRPYMRRAEAEVAIHGQRGKTDVHAVQIRHHVQHEHERQQAKAHAAHRARRDGTVLPLFDISHAGCLHGISGRRVRPALSFVKATLQYRDRPRITTAAGRQGNGPGKSIVNLRLMTLVAVAALAVACGRGQEQRPADQPAPPARQSRQPPRRNRPPPRRPRRQRRHRPRRARHRDAREDYRRIEQRAEGHCDAARVPGRPRPPSRATPGPCSGDVRCLPARSSASRSTRRSRPKRRRSKIPLRARRENRS